MDNPRQSVLDYAHSHGVALAISPLVYLDQASITSTTPPSNPQTQRGFETYISSLHKSIEQDLHTEKVDINKTDALFLATVIQDAKAERVPLVNWDDILPSFDQLERSRVKLELPLLKAESELELSSLKRRSLFDLNEINIPVAPSTDYLSNALDLTAEIKKERLECTKESLRLIQHARKSGDLPLSEVEGLFDSFLGRSLDKTKSAEHHSPLLPFNFIDKSPSPSKCGLPSPESSLPSEKHRQDVTATKIPVLHYSNVRERVWLLGSSDIEDMELSSSESDSPRAPLSLLRNDELDMSPALDTGGSMFEDAMWVDGSETNMDWDVPDTADPNAGNGDIAQTAGGLEDQSYLPMEESSRDHTEHNTNRENGSASAHNTSAAWQNDFYPVVESIEGRNGDPNFPTGGSQNDMLPPAVGIEKDVAEDLDANNPKTTPLAEAGSSRDATRSANEPTDLKRKRGSPSACSRKQTKFEGNNATASLATPFAPLGSLESFMQTRGVARQKIEKSSYFGNQDEVRSGDISAKEETPEQSIPLLSRQIPQCPQTPDPPALFFSSALLKTHVPLVKYLEAKDDPPKLIYRDYGPAIQNAGPDASPAQETPLEADIIISPSTGIALTTSQAITQVYLPGHKPNTILGQITGIDSPIRAHIFQLAPRYEQLYIFVSHNMNVGKSSGKATADEPTLAALTSLIAFCNSMSVYATVTPLLVSSEPDTLGEWVLSLTGKHTFTLPDLVENSISSKNPPGVGDKPSLRIISSEKTAEKASNWELFLRRAGMNPFAALTTLSIMRRHERNKLADAGVLMSDFVYSPDKRKRRVRSLSKFIEMASEQRQELLGGVVGSRVLKRVGNVIEQDVQCDWALDLFDK